MHFSLSLREYNAEARQPWPPDPQPPIPPRVPYQTEFKISRKVPTHQEFLGES